MNLQLILCHDHVAKEPSGETIGAPQEKGEIRAISLIISSVRYLVAGPFHCPSIFMPETVSKVLWQTILVR